MTSINKIVLALRQMGIRIENGRVNKNDFLRVFGAEYKEPEWIQLQDYDVGMPESHMETIKQEEQKLKRVILPSSFLVARFGRFLSEHGDQVSVDGVVYQYSLEGNPRNIRYAYRLFVGVENVAKNSGMTTLHAAKEECANSAKKSLKNLFNLN